MKANMQVLDVDGLEFDLASERRLVMMSKVMELPILAQAVA